MNIFNPFFHVPPNILLNRPTAYPFQIYFFDSQKVEYQFFLESNSPLTLDKIPLLIANLKQGREVAIKLNQQETFLRFFELDKIDIAELTVDTKQLHQRRIEKCLGESLIKSGDPIKQAFKHYFQSNDPQYIVNYFSSQIKKMPQKISPIIEFAQLLVLKQIELENITTRMVWMSYFLAREIGIKDNRILSHIIIASFLYRTGINLAPRSIQAKTDTEQNIPLVPIEHTYYWSQQILHRIGQETLNYLYAPPGCPEEQLKMNEIILYAYQLSCLSFETSIEEALKTIQFNPEFESSIAGLKLDIQVNIKKEILNLFSKEDKDLVQPSTGQQKAA